MWAIQPLWAALAAFALAYLLAWVAEAAKSRVGVPDRPPLEAPPGSERVLAGVGIYLALVIPLLLLAPKHPALYAVIITSGAAFFLGVMDDFWALPRWLKLVALIALAWVATRLGIEIDFIKPPFMPQLFPLGGWSTPITMIWILAVTYAVMFSRRLPGLVCGLVGITSLTFLLVTLLQGQIAGGPLTICLASALAGASLGYARYDFPPSRLRLGSAAHLSLGVALAATSILGALKNTAFLVMVLPALAFGLPLLNTTYAVIFDSRKGKRSFAIAPQREFLHESLIRGGLSLRRCVILLYAALAYLCAVALLLVLLITVSFLIKLLILAVLLIGGFVLFFCAAKIASQREVVPAEKEAKVDLLGVPVSRTDMAGALSRIQEFIVSRSPHMVVTSDSSAIVRARRDPELQSILQAADLVTPDGAGVVWMAKVLDLPLWERVSGVDLVEGICRLAAEQGYSVYLLGAAPGVAEEAAGNLKSRHPGLKVAGTHHGYFLEEEESQIVEEIRSLEPEVLFVALGIPKQEKWIRRHLERLPVSVAIGVGGSFDVISGRVKRAPRWMQRAGLEWLYRTWREPKRIPRLLALPRLVLMTLAQKFLRRR